MSLDLDAFRRDYPHLTYAQHQALYSQVWASHPVQSHFDALECAYAIARVGPARVVEVGGWDGELGVAMLQVFPAAIDGWTNYEVCREAREAGQRRRRAGYHAPDLDKWFWEQPTSADLLVASHTIEHLSAEHLTLLLDATDAPALWFDAPLHDEPTDWMGSTTTHVLEIGWDGVTGLCEERGWSLTWAHDHETSPESGGSSRACLYEKPR